MWVHPHVRGDDYTLRGNNPHLGGFTPTCVGTTTVLELISRAVAIRASVHPGQSDPLSAFNRIRARLCARAGSLPALINAGNVARENDRDPQ